MARVVHLAAGRVAPWRGADWRVVIGEGVLLVLGGAYFLVDGERAEFILGVVVSAALIVDGCRQWYLGFRRLERNRRRDLTLIRGAVGIVVGALVIGLSALRQITVVGIRFALGFGGLAYGLLGLLIAAPSIRRRQASWTSTAFDVLLVALGLLLLYRVATSDSISLLLGAIGWLVVCSGLVIIAAGLVRRPAPQPASTTDEPQP
jgi:uncharacterized membrane protein HdeD (DUF308 family)